jgi:hypothetical protein
MRRLLLVLIAALVLVPMAGAWTWPVDGPVLAPFSYDPTNPKAPDQHRGIDVESAAGPGVVVLAPAAGVVSFAGTVPTNGKCVTIETADGWSVTLTHLGSIAVTKGASVAEGDGVGTIGPSGEPEWSQPYVHLGVRETGDEWGYVDPVSLLPPGAFAVSPSSAASADTTPAPVVSDSTESDPAAPAPPAIPPDPTGATPPSPPVDAGPDASAPGGDGPTLDPDDPTSDAPPQAAAGPDDATVSVAVPAPAAAGAAAPSPSTPPTGQARALPIRAAAIPRPVASAAAKVATTARSPVPDASSSAVEPEPVAVEPEPAAVTTAAAPKPAPPAPSPAAAASRVAVPMRHGRPSIRVAETPAVGASAGVLRRPVEHARHARVAPAAAIATAGPRVVVTPALARLPADGRPAVAAVHPSASITTRVRPPAHHGSPLPPRALVAALLLALVAFAGLAAFVRRMIGKPARMMAPDAGSEEDPRGASLAVCGGVPAPGARGRVRRSFGRVRPLPPARGERRAHGEWDRRARHAGDGGGRRGRELVR